MSRGETDGYQLTTLSSDTEVPRGLRFSYYFLYFGATYGLEKVSKITMRLISKNRIESNRIID